METKTTDPRMLAAGSTTLRHTLTQTQHVRYRRIEDKPQQSNHSTVVGARCETPLVFLCMKSHTKDRGRCRIYPPNAKERAPLQNTHLNTISQRSFTPRA